MIKEVEGDILLTGAQAIAHGVAPNDHFDRGLALSLRKKYPDMVRDFRRYCKMKSPKAGKVWTCKDIEEIVIFNLMTQKPAKTLNGHPRAATLSTVDKCLKRLKKRIKKYKIESIALPKLATGYGKLDWEDVKPLIEKRLGKLDIPIYLYSTFRAGQKAEE